MKDIDFTLKKGEVLGIVGHNGAGKSILFKLLARITFPTKGRVVVNGSLIAMLEVSDKFHAELTGRENIYLSAATYGMKVSKVKEIFDDIVQLSELEDFLYTPVKRYSSGMRTKLAFAIAVMMQPDILILDEILAVSDASFRKKSMELLKQQNEKGQMVKLGNVKEVIQEYLVSKKI